MDEYEASIKTQTEARNTYIKDNFKKWADSNPAPKTPNGTEMTFDTKIDVGGGRLIPSVPCNKTRESIDVSNGVFVCIAEQYALSYAAVSGDTNIPEVKAECPHTAGDKIVIKFMSGDQDEGAYKEYFGSMPWVSDGYDKSAYSTKMSEFGLRGIPALILLKGDEARPMMAAEETLWLIWRLLRRPLSNGEKWLSD